MGYPDFMNHGVYASDSNEPSAAYSEKFVRLTVNITMEHWFLFWSGAAVRQTLNKCLAYVVPISCWSAIDASLGIRSLDYI